MCGLAGVVGARLSPIDSLSSAIAARGPDGQGAYKDAAASIVHTRLAIQDLSAASAQPFHYGHGVLAWNGELYNAQSLRQQLRGHGRSLCTSGDTEVVAAALEHWGTDALHRLRGMFALAWWQPATQRLLLARDRFGMKPLYYRQAEKSLVFASSARPLMSQAASPELAAAYLVRGSLAEPDLLGVREVRAGGWLQVTGDRQSHGEFAAVGDRLDGLGVGSGPELAPAFADSVDAHLVADVPVALLLSGGVDSTAIALQAGRLGHGLTCFTVDRGDGDWEPAIAEKTAARYGHQHHTVTLGHDQSALFEAYVEGLDLPSIDGFNIFAVSRAVHEAGFKVVLAGTGGDELLGGYRTYRLLAPARLAASIPSTVMQRLAAVAKLEATQQERLMAFHHAKTLASFHAATRSVFSQSEISHLTGVDPPTLPTGSWPMSTLTSGAATRQLALLEMNSYLRYTLLRDGDTSAMANAVEMRFPFVDSEFAATALARLQRFPRAGKPRFVAALDDEWLRHVSHHRKRGFDMPLDQLLRESLHSQVNSIETLAEDGLLLSSPLLSLLRGWEKGEVRAVKVWALMMLAVWSRGNSRSVS